MSDAHTQWHSERLAYRAAAADDLPLVAAMNRQLILDEGHGNPMSESELESRMRAWLEPHEYEVTIVDFGDTCIGYALWQRQEFCLYVRHFFIAAGYRRQGFGREAMRWMRDHLWNDNARIRLDVLVDNLRGIGFWRALGFEDYCITLELHGPVKNCGDRSGSRT